MKRHMNQSYPKSNIRSNESDNLQVEALPHRMIDICHTQINTGQKCQDDITNLQIKMFLSHKRANRMMPK